jgi:hypothetical protein
MATRHERQQRMPGAFLGSPGLLNLAALRSARRYQMAGLARSNEPGQPRGGSLWTGSAQRSSTPWRRDPSARQRHFLQFQDALYFVSIARFGWSAVAKLIAAVCSETGDTNKEAKARSFTRVGPTLASFAIGSHPHEKEAPWPRRS